MEMGKIDFTQLHKNIRDEEESSWALSFSDMTTLLLCFFVMLIGISNIDVMKMEMMSQTFSESKRITMKELARLVQDFINSKNLQQEVNVQLTTKGVEISFKDKLLFDIGKADLKDAALPILSEMSSLLNYKEIADRKISVEGHTDSVPIKSAVYPSNWELSSARAASVVKHFIAYKLNSKRFESIGYADTRPIKQEIEKNVGYPENRRVVIVVSPEPYVGKSERKEITVSSMKSDPSAVYKASQIIEEGKKTEPAVPTQPAKTALPAPPSVQGKTNAALPTSPEPSVAAAAPSGAPEEKDDKSRMREYFADGQTHFKKGEFQKAIASWEKVLAIDPSHELSKKNIQRAKNSLKNGKQVK